MAQNEESSQTPGQITALYNYRSWGYSKNWNPLHIVDGEGCYFIDASGKRYLDFSGQLVCMQLGYKNRAVIKAIEDQANKLSYINPVFTTDARAELSQELVSVMPEGLNKFFFATSGTEANEAAIKIARMVTGKTKIIARYRSYHGATMGAIAATSDPRRWAMEPAGKIPGVIFAPEVDCFRCPLRHGYPGCGIACVEYIEHMIEHESDVAAVLVEPIVGTNGVLVPPNEYMPRLCEICTAHNVLLIADEVMTGWGRTGQWFAMNLWNVKPDILTTAKGITAAYMPLGVCATTPALAAYFETHYFSHGHTYEAHPMTLAPAIAVIREYKRLNLIERANEMGAYLGKELQELERNHRSVGDVRGVGMFWAVDLVKDQATKRPFNTYSDKIRGESLVVDKVAAQAMKNGVYIMAWVNHFIIAPPLIIEKHEIDEGLQALDQSLKIADELC